MTNTETQAAEPVLDATAPAPSADETQHIYAWSHDDDDTELATTQRRSWKLPIALASLAAAAAITTGTIIAWPEHHIVAAQTPTAPAQISPAPERPLKIADPSPAAPMPPPTPDQQFVAALEKEGLKPVGDPAVAIRNAHRTCDYLAAGHTRTQAVQYYTAGNPELTPAELATIIELAAQTYCPAY